METAPGESKQVLIIDDDQNHVLLLEKRLRAAGYRTLTATNGMDGLRQAVHQMPDLIITDVLLPKLNGFELTSQIKSNPETSGIPVIMMSAVYVTDEDMARGFQMGAETYVSKADLALRKPLQEEALLEAAEALLRAKSAEPARPARILAVDDEPDILRLITKRLELQGYQLETAADGRQAIDKMEEADYDLVLLDVRLPKLDGLDVLSRIRERRPDAAVVMMTAYGSEQVAAEALRRGADDYITKPLDEGELTAAVSGTLKKAAQRWRMNSAAARLREDAAPELAEKERLIDELRQSSITLMDQYDRLLAAEEQNRIYAERLEQMVDERARDLKRRNEELAILHSVLSAATHSLELADVFSITLDQLEAILGTQSLAAFVIDPDSGRLRLGSQRNMPADFLRWASRAPGGEGIIAGALDSGGRRVVDIVDDAMLAAWFPGGAGSRLIVFPMTSPNEVVGIIAGVCGDCELDEGIWRLLDSIGDELGVIVDNVRLYDNLRGAYLSTIRALAEAVDARDAYTRGHSDRVSAFAVAIAREMGLDEEILAAVRDAGYLHDIGKIGTPDAVLHKEGELTAEEMGTMKQHPGTSHKILAQASIPDEIKEMIRHHHERFGGGGYPDGLTEEGIPLGSRILCVADAFEAMTSERPYRLALSDEAAVTELKRCAGEQFDPQVVEAFLQIWDKVESGETGGRDGNSGADGVSPTG